jgi:hypothetical protein
MKRFFERRKAAYQAFVEKQAGRSSRPPPRKGEDSSKVSIADNTAGTRVSLNE